MKLLNEISDASLGLTDFEILHKKFELRKSARAILLNTEGLIAIQYLNNHHFHKLPGGGVEIGETIPEALLREIKEEVGCKAQITKDIGVVIEYRKEHELMHISYCFAAHIDGVPSSPALEQAEIDEGMVTLWMSPEEAISRMETDVPTTYQGKFILERELSFLREFVKDL